MDVRELIDELRSFLQNKRYTSVTQFWLHAYSDNSPFPGGGSMVQERTAYGS
jgi:hypothetical protein